MKRIHHTSPALQPFCLLALAAISFSAGCGTLRTWFSRTEPDKPHSVTLSWTPSKSAVAGYNVYREAPFSGPVKLTATAVSSAEYTDRTVKAGQTYSYFVRSVDSKGIESRGTDRIFVTVPAR